MWDEEVTQNKIKESVEVYWLRLGASLGSISAAETALTFLETLG